MYYVRIVFLINEGYDFDTEDEFILFESGSVVCRVKIDRRFEKLKVIMSYGGFEDREIAEIEGNKLFYSVKKSFIKKGIPINISGGLGVLDTTQISFATGEITEYGLKNIEMIFPQSANKTVKNELLGMGIYQLDEDISEVKFLSQSVKAQLTTQFPEIEVAEYIEDEKINIAYSLLNSSNAINDLRASFLLKVSSIESLVSEDSYKDDSYCYFIKQINKSITMENINIDIDIPEKEKQKIIQSIKSSIGLLKKKTIGEKCRELIKGCNFKKNYNGKNAITFFDECYKIRSEFVHTGTYKTGVSEIQKIRELETYKMELNRLIIDVLDYYERNTI
ncbi:hypothetical protein [Bacillus sp. V33-4]|uniref:hypothetical protein n=1 Tax=Bacillus sp. V33-4 TaxID=2054169 RepID=UPI000C761E41|nr:hypothetical protein [Bacillus sp. V33-4]PLR82553.1 hypothetical protein CVD23_16485 [Bacillus sp. V33-4]